MTHKIFPYNFNNEKMLSVQFIFDLTFNFEIESVAS